MSGRRQPILIIIAIVTNCSAVIVDAEKLSHGRFIDFAPISAADVSYTRLPMTDKRSQGKGIPSFGARAATPMKMLIAGAIENIAARRAVRLITPLSMPIFFDCLTARTRKNIDCASTYKITTAAMT